MGVATQDQQAHDPRLIHLTGPAEIVTDDLDQLLEVLPPHICDPLLALEDRRELLEVVMDLGREPEARFPGREHVLSPHTVTEEDIEYVVQRIGAFGDDNRAGIERTLHRISAIRNREGRIVGITCRVGRAVFGTITIIRDIVESGRSILMMGRPGVGKTTLLREAARVLADDLRKRVMIVDTSNEIGGDGDIPHPAVGRARRMQVPTPSMQHAVMIEAVENHMPEVIVIDEIGTELEAAAARTIAERGVQLVATAHGNTLENLMLNPTLSDVIGGIQSVTLSDEEAQRRGTHKSVLERKAPPTFDVVVEIHAPDEVAVHDNVADAVDAILRGQVIPPTIRVREPHGEVAIQQAPVPPPRPAAAAGVSSEGSSWSVHQRRRPLHIYAFGVHRPRLEREIRDRRLPVRLVASPRQADAVVALRTYYRRHPGPLREAQELGVPVHVLRSDGPGEIAHALRQLFEHEGQAESHRLGLAHQPRQAWPEPASAAIDDSDPPH